MQARLARLGFAVRPSAARAARAARAAGAMNAAGAGGPLPASLAGALDAVSARLRPVLASGSPRRRELLAQMGLSAEVVKSTFEEDLPKEGFEGAGEYAAATAAAKAEEVARRLEAEGRGGRLVIGADTVVEAPGELDLSEAVLEKPANEEHARRMLLRLSGATHRVHTGVAVVLPGETAARTFHETTRVTFGPLDEGAIAAYVATGDCMDKAGSYGIQGAAGAFVSGIEGCYFNVVGFPMHRFSVELAKLVHEHELLDEAR